MENTIQMTGGELAVVHAKRRSIPFKPPDPDMSVPDREMMGPRPIGEIMEPILLIIEHPDRNRLLAEFCKKHW